MTQETKVCSKCGKEKPLDSFRWLYTQDRYQSRCKECEREYSREYNRAVSADKRAEYTITHKLTHVSATKVLQLLTQQKDIYMNQLKTLQSNIEQWAVDRDLHTGDPNYQVLKLIEEQGKFAAGLARDKNEEMVDAVGDMVVVSIVLAKRLGATVDLWKVFAEYVENHQEKMRWSLAIAALAGTTAHIATGVHFKVAEDSPVNLSLAIEQVIMRVVSLAIAFDIDFISAVQSAYDTIKDHKGKLVNGVFIKEDA